MKYAGLYLKAIILILLLSLKLNTVAQDSEKIAGYIEASIQNGNPSFINSIFDYNSFKKNFIINKVSFAEFNRQFNHEAASLIDPGSLVLAQLTPSSNYQLVNITNESNLVVFTFRVSSESGLDYHKYFLEHKDGQLRIVDLYMYYEDILLSEKVEMVYKTLCSSERPDLQTQAQLKSYAQLVEDRAKLRMNMVNGKWLKVVKQYNKLDLSIRNDRDVLTSTLRAASYLNVDDSEVIYNKLKEHKYSFGADLIVLEGYFNMNAHQEVLRHIDLVDQSVGYDPYLNYFRASIFKLKGDENKAEWLLNQTIRELPEEQSAYFSLLELYLENARYSDASTLLDTLTNTFGFYKEELAPLLAEYPNYIDSKEYSIWIEKL